MGGGRGGGATMPSDAFFFSFLLSLTIAFRNVSDFYFLGGGSEQRGGEEVRGRDGDWEQDSLG